MVLRNSFTVYMWKPRSGKDRNVSLLIFQSSTNSFNKERRETLRKKIVSLTLKKKSKITKVGYERVQFSLAGKYRTSTNKKQAT